MPRVVRRHSSPVARATLWSLGLAAVAAVGLFLSPAARAADVGVSISISQPGVYGRIDIGRFPQPELVVAQPVIIHRPRVVPQPVYLWVPPGHQKNWGKHCGRYNACGVPVYFVKDEWYHRHVDRRDGDHDDRGERGERGGPPGHSNGHGRGRGHD